MEYIQSPHPEDMHKSHRAGWLRAAVLGVNDGIVSVSSLVIGVLAASANRSTILTVGIAGLAAGALSMAVGEYISVSSQRDSEEADITIERRSLKNNPEKELNELIFIYIQRGLDADLAKKVAIQLHNSDAVAAHARDELGINASTLAKPLQAALASASAFSLGASFPIIAALISDNQMGPWLIVLASLLTLALSGAVGALIGGGNKLIAATRVLIGGGLAMAVTALIGHFLGNSV